MDGLSLLGQTPCVSYTHAKNATLFSGLRTKFYVHTPMAVLVLFHIILTVDNDVFSYINYTITPLNVLIHCAMKYVLWT